MSKRGSRNALFVQALASGTWFDDGPVYLLGVDPASGAGWFNVSTLVGESMCLKFDSLPTVMEWRAKHGNSVPYPQDRFFIEIERLLTLIGSANGEPEDLWDLYLLCDFYLKDSHKKHGAKSNERATQMVDAMRLFLTDILSATLESVEGESLRIKILGLLGKQVHDSYDINAERHLYITAEKEQQVNKLCFRNGLAYLWEGERTGILGYFGEKKLVKFNSNSSRMSSHSGMGWAIFVLGPKGRIYVGKHMPEKFYHSCLLAASATFAAGEIFVNDGRVTDITCHSGHYKPGSRQMLNMVERLLLYGVNLQQLNVWTFVLDGNNHPKKVFGDSLLFKVCSGQQFLSCRGVEPANATWRRAMQGDPVPKTAVEMPAYFA